MADILYLSHGGGPRPLLGDPDHQQLVDQLSQLGTEMPRPEAILVISAHWEASQATITSALKPELIYDYYGFPPESYQITYPATGNPALAQRLAEMLADHGITAQLDPQRGFDHGLFVPLKLMRPQADIPCLQLSLLNHLDPEAHIRLGEALSALRDEPLLIIGSGFSFHNMRAFFAPDTAESRQQNLAFEQWLQESCCSQQLSEPARRQRLIDWEQAPGARYCHPREEHLLPLQVCYGIAQTAARAHYSLEILGKQASLVLW